jgi:pilus assembly protein CpaE
MIVGLSSNDASATSALRSCLDRLKIDCPASRVVGHEAISLLLPGDPSTTSLVFFASRQFGANEWATLKQLLGEDNRQHKVIVVGAGLSPAAILQAIRLGASDCLDIQGNLESDLREAIDRITASQNGSRAPGRVYSVIGSGGGVGATLVATNLAAAFARRGLSTVLLDLHVRGGDVATMLNCRARHTLADLAAKNDHFDLAMFEQALVKHEAGFGVLASPEPFSDYRAIRTQLIRRVVQFACHLFTDVIIDLEDCDHDEQLRVLASSEHAVHIVRPDFVSVRRGRKLYEFLSRAKVPPDRVTTVVNRMGGAKALDEKMVEDGLAARVAHFLPEDADTVNQCVNLGAPFVLAHPEARISQAIEQLTATLTGSPPAQRVESWPRRQLKRLAAAFA